jgi:fatty-acyl-CoA synthase
VRVPGPGEISKQVETKVRSIAAMTRAGVIRPGRPDRVFRIVQTLVRWGATPAAATAANAIRYPGEIGLVDDDGQLTFMDLHLRSNALAHALSDRGVLEGDGIAILARNHRYFIDATLAASKLGARALFLNTSFSGPQAHEVLEREKPKAVIYDAEFCELMAEGTEGRRAKHFIAYAGEDDETPDDIEKLADLIAEGDDAEVVPPAEEGRMVILTSGTTGTPKGASRASPGGIDPLGGLLNRVPYKVRETMVNAPPLFHAWGASQFVIASSLSLTMVVQRKFDPEETLAAIDKHKAEILVVVPVMLSRILKLEPEVRAKYDTSSLRIVFASGSAVSSDLACKWMDTYGENLYNLYGSTEVAWATIATPKDMRQAPGTTGRPPLGTTVKILDKEGYPLPTGDVGRIFVGSDLVFEGYTGGGSKEIVDGLMSTGDMGHLDKEGRLFIDSREDDMIVSGGENVYPGEVEELLQNHNSIEDAAVVGVEDEEFGQRLKAYVVTSGSLSEDDVKKYVKDNLARYKVPREVEFLDELPRNATGKVLKRELGKEDEEEDE